LGKIEADNLRGVDVCVFGWLDYFRSGHTKENSQREMEVIEMKGID